MLNTSADLSNEEMASHIASRRHRIKEHITSSTSKIVRHSHNSLNNMESELCPISSVGPDLVIHHPLQVVHNSTDQDDSDFGSISAEHSTNETASENSVDKHSPPKTSVMKQSSGITAHLKDSSRRGSKRLSVLMSKNPFESSKSVFVNGVWDSGMVELAKGQVVEYEVECIAGEYILQFTKHDNTPTRIISCRLKVWAGDESSPASEWRGSVGNVTPRVEGLFSVKQYGHLTISFKSHSLTSFGNPVKFRTVVKLVKTKVGSQEEASEQANGASQTTRGSNIKGAFTVVDPSMNDDQTECSSEEAHDSEELLLNATMNEAVVDIDDERHVPVDGSRVEEEAVLQFLDGISVSKKEIVHELPAGVFYIGIRNHEANKKLAVEVQLLRRDGLICFEETVELKQGESVWRYCFSIKRVQAPAKLTIRLKSASLRPAKTSVKLCKMREVQAIKLIMERSKKHQLYATLALTALLFLSYASQIVTFLFSLEIPLTGISVRLIATVLAGVSLYYYREELLEMYRENSNVIKDKLAFFKVIGEPDNSGLQKLRMLSARSKKKKVQKQLKDEAKLAL